MRVSHLFIAALLISASASAQTVRTGIEAWSRGDYAKALATWRPLAARGDPDAMFNLGQAYRLGKGVPIDLAQALHWYTGAAELGHVDGQTELGILLFRNGNQLSALRWLRAAADKGEPRAELLYGTALFNGDGIVRRDPEAAYRYVARSAAQGLAPAMTTLAEMDQVIPADVRARALGVAKTASAKPAIGKPASARPSPPIKPVTVARMPPPPKSATTPTAPRPVSTATAAPVSGGWRIQLGAFGQRGAAEALFRKLAAGPLAGKQPVLTAVGSVTRLQVGPYASKAAAGAVCSSLTARGQACFAVPAH